MVIFVAFWWPCRALFSKKTALIVHRIHMNTNSLLVHKHSGLGLYSLCLNLGRSLSQAIKMLYFIIKSFCVFLRLWLLLLVGFGNAALRISSEAEETVSITKKIK